MVRHRIAPLAITLVLAACASTGGSASGSAAKNQPSPEMQRLAPMVGSWSGTCTIVSPTAQERASMGMPAMPEKMKGGGEYSWTLDGKFLEMEGWHEMAPGQKEHYREFVGWDASARKYHSWYFGSSGERGEGWMTIDPDGKTFRVKADGVDAAGAPKSGTGTMTFVSNEEIKWTWSENGPQGTMKLEGTNKKK